MKRRQMLAALAASTAGLIPILSAAAEAEWPTRPVRLVVPYPPGGATDIVTRVTAERLSQQLGQPFVVENRPGGGGNIGAEAVARAPADGYTLLIATTAHAINKTLFKKPGYDINADFVPISILTKGPLVLVVNPEAPARTVRDLIALAKANPASVAYASSGNGQSTHMAAELLATTTGIQLRHIPYKGSAPALADVVAGHVPMMFDAMLSCMPFVKSGRLRAIAVTGSKRSPVMPDVPTMEQAGVPGYELYAWYALLAPARTPQPVVHRLSSELKAALNHPQVQKVLQEQGLSSGWDELAPTSGYLHSEVTKWEKVVKVSGATID